MDLGLDGKVALVTASSKGLGKACAKELASEGANVVMCARTPETLAEAAKEVEQAGSGQVKAVVADLSQQSGIDAAIGATLEAHGRIDILLTNTGGPPLGTFGDATDEQWLETFENLHLGAVRLIRAVLPSMRENKWGRIIGIQSSSLKQPIPGLTLSNGVRPAVAGLFKSLMPEIAEDNITINLVVPGIILTDRIIKGQTARAEAAGKTLEEQLAALASTIPAGRLGEPEELAAMVAFVASERAAYVTGSVVQVDGGFIRSVV